MGIKEEINRIASRFVKKSDWKFVTSAGATLSIGTPVKRIAANTTAGAIWIKNDSGESPIKLTYIAIGGSIGVNQGSPVNFSFSIPQMPSKGRVYKLPLAGFSLTLNELKGTFLMMEGAGDLGAGVSFSTMFIGGSKAVGSLLTPISGGQALQIPAFMATSKGCVSFRGATATPIVANVSATIYAGIIF